MRNILLAVLVFVVSGCAATGPKFSGLNSPPEGLAGIYILRQAKSVAAAYCPPVEIDGDKVGCLRNGGYLYVEVEPGLHELRFVKRFGEIGKERYVQFESVAGQLLFAEWVYSAGDAQVYGNSGFSMTFSEGIVPHNKESALMLLKHLNESR